MQVFPLVESNLSGLEMHYFGPAEVVSVNDRSVCITRGIQQCDARLAVLNYVPQAGDQVLVAGDAVSGYFVIGVLEVAHQESAESESQEAKVGGRRIEIADGDLEFVTRNGKIRFVSAAGIELTALAAPVDVRSGVAVRMSILGGVGQRLSKFHLFGRSAELNSESIDLTSEELQIRTKRAGIAAHQLDALVHDARIDTHRVQLTTETLISKARNVYQQVSQLWQLVAGRSRMVVEGTSHHKANRIYAKAVNDVKINGEKIHLG